jgi:hypothetical protein
MTKENFNSSEEIKFEEMNLGRRKGIVKLPFVMFERPSYRQLQCLFSNFFPVDIIPGDFLGRNRIYRGFSLYFRELEEGEILPTYEFTFKCQVSENCTETILLEKVEEIK